jgi:oligopeptide/dipeptide ABC transporter ATP-binding protein
MLKLVPQPPAVYGPKSRIEFAKTNLLQADRKTLRRIRGAEIAMIFQEPTTSLNPVLTVGSQIVEALRAHRDVSKAHARKRTVELLELVGIPDPGHRFSEYPHQMSGGMQQRVMIAMALSCQPKLLIADEPTTALDVTIQAQILDLLADLKQQFNMSVVFITHDLGVLASVADRVIVMYAGQIVEHATVRDLFAKPAHPYTQGLLRAVPRLDRPIGRLEGIEGSVPDAAHWPSGCRFHPRCPKAFDPCPTEPPPAFDIGERHQARCWLCDPERSR